jgi:DNA repair protein RadC
MKTYPSVLKEMEVKYLPSKDIIKQPTIESVESAEKLFRSIYNPNTIALKEEVYAVYLNTSNKVLGFKQISSGGITSTVVDIRIILGIALKSAAKGIILAHNHPSGNLSPSDADNKLTDKLYKACKIMDIDLVDHIIISPFGGYYSFMKEGALSL